MVIPDSTPGVAITSARSPTQMGLRGQIRGRQRQLAAFLIRQPAIVGLGGRESNAFFGAIHQIHTGGRDCQ